MTEAKAACSMYLHNVAGGTTKVKAPAPGGTTKVKAPAPGGTTKVKAPAPGKAAATAKRTASTGGSSLLKEDSGTTVGKYLP